VVLSYLNEYSLLLLGPGFNISFRADRVTYFTEELGQMAVDYRGHDRSVVWAVMMQESMGGHESTTLLQQET
jgi:hypothetical protein